MVLEGATTARAFETHVEHLLVPRSQAGAGGGDGQPRSSQAKEGKGVDRRGELRAHVPAALLPGPKPDRGSFLEDLKHILRNIGARGKEALIEAMGRALWEL